MDYLQPIWAIEALFVVVLYFIKVESASWNVNFSMSAVFVLQDKHTNDSFFTQLCTWALFALGSYAIVGGKRALQPAPRSAAMKISVQLSRSNRPHGYPEIVGHR